MSKTLTSIIFILYISFGFAQNGKIISKRLVHLNKTPVWNEVAKNDTLKPQFRHLGNINFYFITYQSDGFTVKGIVIEPKLEGKYPVVIFNRGGNRNYGQLTITTLMRLTAKLAENGYVIIGSNYREKDEFGGEEINDVLYLTETIKELEKADTSRIGMLGWSRGGMMTYLALQKSNKIKTAIVGNGASDLFDSAKFRPKMETNVFAECIPDYWENRTSELKKRSAIYWVDELNKNSSLLILCGTNDKRVNPKQADRIAKKLSEINYDFELKKYETDHFFSRYREELNNLIINWFDMRLKK